MNKHISLVLLFSFVSSVSYGMWRIQAQQWDDHHTGCVNVLQDLGGSHSKSADQLALALGKRDCSQLPDKAQDCCKTLLALEAMHERMNENERKRTR